VTQIGNHQGSLPAPDGAAMETARLTTRAKAEIRRFRKSGWYLTKFIVDRAASRDTGISPRQVFWINPNAIAHTLSPRLDDERLRGRIVAGDWDRSLYPIEDLPTYVALRQRVLEGRAWEETVLHPRRYVATANAPREVRKFANLGESAFSAWGYYVDQLRCSLERHGWQEARALGAPFYHNLSLAVTRDGAVVRVRSGLHRLILGQLLDLRRIPAVLFCVHRDFPGGRPEVADLLDRAAGGLASSRGPAGAGTAQILRARSARSS
jgi:hypothetical protein